MNTLTTTEIVKKLIGEIRPIGETNEDKKRFENLKNLCELVESLVSEIDLVNCDFHDSYESSVKNASNFASNFLDNLIIKQD